MITDKRELDVATDARRQEMLEYWCNCSTCTDTKNRLRSYKPNQLDVFAGVRSALEKYRDWVKEGMP